MNISNREYVKALLKVMNDNPTLEVLCRVDSEIVADDGYAWWLGKLSTKIGICIDEYSDCIGEEIKFRSDEDWEEWYEDLGYDFDDVEYDYEVMEKVDEVANWKKQYSLV